MVKVSVMYPNTPGARNYTDLAPVMQISEVVVGQ